MSVTGTKVVDLLDRDEVVEGAADPAQPARGDDSLERVARGGLAGIREAHAIASQRHRRRDGPRPSARSRQQRVVAGRRAATPLLRGRLTSRCPPSIARTRPAHKMLGHL